MINNLLGSVRNQYQTLNGKQKRFLGKYFILINFIMLLIIAFLGERLYTMRKVEMEWIGERVDRPAPTKEEITHLSNMPAIDTSIYMMRMSDINMKEKTMQVRVVVNLDYAESNFPDGTPGIGIFNGTLKEQQQVSRRIKNGRVHEILRLTAEVEPYYMLPMYPLDLELISVRLSPKVEDDPYYFRLVDFQDMTYVAQNDYQLVKTGFVNEVESDVTASLTDSQHQVKYYGLTRAYMLFEHKNVYSYLKTVQYMLLAISIALFALLINAKTNSPKNGRVAVIGSSVFALSATVFQLNASIKVINALTIIDLFTFYSGLVILICFLVTIRTLRLLDEEGYATAKLFDQIMFITIFIYTCIFFIGVYLYA
ncbi:hypothetical protein [Aquella oligotrophica]|uniref:Uncharacterized protein n=1 Tax=Aquella oligotrophica TaxID=2067065 RepID=A0A2I7N8H8_9NEIS|nr:hypothetical protein [Aquella oligotrophica]AUR52763.1 hypothetical protein CUN60_10820 [Aquella oligotrophica]